MNSRRNENIMKQLGINEIRTKFKDFFESKGHYIAPSHSLVPDGDKSLLLINSGMAPLKNYFAGIEKPPKERMSTCQKCIRTGDIENVGVTARHATFFEMMGNFSFGDYFKDDAIKWSYEFVTKWLEIPEDKIWVTVYEDDDEAFEIWENKINFPKEKIVRLGKEDNFWEIGLGPCGPCSEIYFDRGEEYGCDDPNCKPGCDCDRFLEFWNLVFTQFDRKENGDYEPLENKNIDTGMGLERMGCIMQNVDTIFEVDTIKYLLDKICSMSGVKYGENPKNDKSIRIITDHTRAVTFMIGDGILPSNEGRGYVLRRLLRRASRHGKLLGNEEPFIYKLVEDVVKTSGDAYSEIKDNMEYIQKVVRIEEEKFAETIDQGSDMLIDYIEKMKEKNIDTLDGSIAFKLYDTYGFPIDLTQEILEDENLKVDLDEFEKEMEAQKNRAREARGNMEDESWKVDPLSQLEDVKSEFKGYFDLSEQSNVSALVVDSEIVRRAKEGQDVIIVLDSTTFYPEGGGQVGDRGLIISEGGLRIEVRDTKKGANGSIRHFGKVVKGEVKVGDRVTTAVDVRNRISAGRNHSATHLLHAALKEVLGAHVNQAGSLVTADRLRFDITHFEAIKKDELEKIEKIVNDNILRALPVSVGYMNIEEAKASGAQALFGEKYGDIVRVVTMGDASVELCGGTHLNNTAEIGAFKILSESGVASGVRRIEAITGYEVYRFLNEKIDLLEEISSSLKVQESNIVSKVKSLSESEKDLKKELHDIKQKESLNSLADIENSKVDVDGITVIASKISGMDNNLLRENVDMLRDKNKNCVILLISVDGDRGSIVATASKEAIDRGIHSGNLLREIAKIAGGKGGGRPNMAQGAISDTSRVDQAISAVVQEVKKQLS